MKDRVIEVSTHHINNFDRVIVKKADVLFLTELRFCSRAGAAPIRFANAVFDFTRKRVGELLRAIGSYDGFFATKCALRLSPLVFVQPGELRGAQWSEIDFDKAEWRIPAERMKMREQHIVPLSYQSVEILRELEPLTSRGIPAKPNAPRYVFPGAQDVTRSLWESIAPFKAALC